MKRGVLATQGKIGRLGISAALLGAIVAVAPAPAHGVTGGQATGGPALHAGLARAVVTSDPSGQHAASALPRFSATPVTGAPIPATFFGIHQTSSQRMTLPSGSVRLWDSGTTWREIERANDQWDFTTLDRLVAKYRTRGTDVMLVLGSTPQWAAKHPDSPGPRWIGNGAASMVARTADWVDYVSRVAKRYKGRISSYQIWNEATLPTFWTGTFDELAELTDLARRAIRAADPHASVVSTAVLPRQATWLKSGAAYMAALKARGWPIDVLAFHGYTEMYGSPDQRVRVIERVRRFMAGTGAPAIPLWESETNYTTDRRATTIEPRVSGAKAAAWVVRAYIDSARLGVARSYWYGWGPVPPHLLIDLARDRVAARGYRTAAAWLVGWSLRSCSTRTLAAGRVTTCTLSKDGTLRRVLWANRPVKALTPRGFRTICTATGTCAKTGHRIALSPSPVLLK